MKQVVIENPIINSPFAEPERHFRFDDDGITNEIVESRRISHYFVPIAQPKKKTQQIELDLSGWTQDRVKPNDFINRVREKVRQWRWGGYQYVTPTTKKLLQHWIDPERDRKLFFCQIEALETVIYITEVARKLGENWISNELKQFSEDANPSLLRIACKMATGSGKTLVMSMLIAWNTLNKLANPQSRMFSDAFLIVAPGITIRDRLRVLKPNDPENYYRRLDLVPADLLPELDKAKIVIINYHSFLLREQGEKASKTTKSILTQGGESPFTETPAQMVRRVCRELGNKQNIIVINDEAHHCYRGKTSADKLKGDERKEAEKRDLEARVWISGIEAIQQKLGVRIVYDLSATPFFLKGSGYSEGELFPWVVSDFSLIDAIESGIVKIPRVPIDDDSQKGTMPAYRNIWALIRDHLPKGTKADKEASKAPGGPNLPMELEGALTSLYDNYKKAYTLWEQNGEAQAQGITTPVFIVVCNNTAVSKLVYDYICGWETGKLNPDGSPILAPGKLELFNNVEHGQWTSRPSTILVDSEQLESGDAMSADFKKIAAQEIEEFKAEYRDRYPGSDPDKISDEDLLREVMNTVGKPGKLGEQIKCVVSVSMLTEGWDANTVTHVLGVRAFGTQLLCEQVVGRGLRRISYALTQHQIDVNGQRVAFQAFEPEYAEVYGVPFAFIPCAKSGDGVKARKIPTRVRSIESRAADCEIQFPKLLGYRYDISSQTLTHKFTPSSKLTLSTEDLPIKTENAPIVGASSIHSLEDLKQRREQEVVFLLAKLVLEKYFRWDGENRPDKTDVHQFDSEVQAWLFPQLLQITRAWLKECVKCKAGTFKQELLLIELAHEAADKIYGAIAASEGKKTLKPILKPNDTIGTSSNVDFDSIKAVYATSADRCHVSHVVLDSNWEAKMAQVLETMPEVVCYVKNDHLGFHIPYTMSGDSKNYVPDFIVRVNDGDPDGLLNLVVEVSGQSERKDKLTKAFHAKNFWVPAVNNHDGFGRWGYIEIIDPWNAETAIRAALQDGDL
jgi:type III restriction enzyme